MSEKCTPKDDLTMNLNNLSEFPAMSCEVRRKRKSCELTKTPEDVEDVKDTKRSRVALLTEVSVDSPKSEDSNVSGASNSTTATSSSTTTSGIDVTETTQDTKKGEVVNITSFTRFEPCDPATPRKLKSALKTPKSKTEKKSIRFDVVQEFRFNRIQSFVTLPSYGGLSLGMDIKHYNGRELSLDRYRVERERSRRRKVSRWRKRQQQVDVVTNSSSDSESGSEDEQFSAELLGMHPVPPERRRRLLMRAGYEITNDSVLDDQHIQKSRELCGCSCQGICYPDSCACYANGIGCQVDRSDRSFPCGCQPSQCWNPAGRTSFNADRVKSHFIQTMSRINTNQEIPESVLFQSQADHHFSFGDFTLPCGDPPSQRGYQHQLHHQHHYWTHWNWGDNGYNTINSSIGMQTYDTFYGFHDMMTQQQQQQQQQEHPQQLEQANIEQLPSTATATTETTQQQTVQKYPTEEQKSDSSICVDAESTASSCDEKNDNERLSESSESGIGDETSSSSPPTVTTFQMCGSIETSMTVAYNDDSNNSQITVPVGSE